LRWKNALSRSARGVEGNSLKFCMALRPQPFASILSLVFLLLAYDTLFRELRRTMSCALNSGIMHSFENYGEKKTKEGLFTADFGRCE